MIEQEPHEGNKNSSLLGKLLIEVVENGGVGVATIGLGLIAAGKSEAGLAVLFAGAAYERFIGRAISGLRRLSRMNLDAQTPENPG